MPMGDSEPFSKLKGLFKKATSGSGRGSFKGAGHKLGAGAPQVCVTAAHAAGAPLRRCI